MFHPTLAIIRKCYEVKLLHCILQSKYRCTTSRHSFINCACSRRTPYSVLVRRLCLCVFRCVSVKGFSPVIVFPSRTFPCSCSFLHLGLYLCALISTCCMSNSLLSHCNIFAFDVWILMEFVSGPQ